MSKFTFYFFTCFFFTHWIICLLLTLPPASSTVTPAISIHKSPLVSFSSPPTWQLHHHHLHLLVQTISISNFKCFLFNINIVQHHSANRSIPKFSKITITINILVTQAIFWRFAVWK